MTEREIRQLVSDIEEEIEDIAARKKEAQLAVEILSRDEFNLVNRRDNLRYWLEHKGE